MGEAVSARKERPNTGLRGRVSRQNLSDQSHSVQSLSAQSEADDTISSEQLEISRRRNSAILSIAKSLSFDLGDLPTIFRSITETGAEILDLDRVSIWLYDESREYITCVDLYERPPHKHSSGARLDSIVSPPYFTALEENRVVCASDVLNNPITCGFAEVYSKPLGIASLLDATLRVGGKTIGVICHESVGERRNWSIGEQSFAASLADLLALAIERRDKTIAQDTIKYRLDFECLIISLATNFINLPATEIDEGINSALKELGEFCDVDRSYVALLTDDGVKINEVWEWCREDITPQIERLKELTFTDFSWFTQMALSQGHIKFTSLSELPPEAANEVREYEYENIRSLVCVPIILHGDAIGFLGFDSVRQEKEWSQDAVKLLQLTAEMFINAIQRKHVEEEIRKHLAILEVTHDAIIVMDTTGKIQFWNKGAEQIYGYPRWEAFGNSYCKFLAVEPGFRDRLSQALLTKGEWRGESVHKTKLGEQKVIESRCALIRDSEGAPWSILLVNSDISERKRWEEHSQQASKLEMVGLLAGGIAHDFNNILTAIAGNLSLAKTQAGIEGNVLEHVLSAERATLRARDLTYQLLTFARGGAPVRKSASIVELIQETAEFALRGRRSICNFNLPSDTWPAEVDEGQISQVIQNLILNADQAMPAGGTVHITSHNVEIVHGDENPRTLGAGRYVAITIRDEGIGIPSEIRSKIFDPYFTTKRSGSGLGLATSYSIIKKHLGEFEVESTPGAGSTFRFYLPASDVAPTPKIDRSLDVIRGAGRILIMDDDELIRETLSGMLRHLGYDVDVTSEGKEAIEKYTKSIKCGDKYDAVVMDLTIRGGMGGKEAVQELRKIDPLVRAIVSSGYSNDPTMSNFKDYGFCSIVKKPYTLGELSKVMVEVLK